MWSEGGFWASNPIQPSQHYHWPNVSPGTYEKFRADLHDLGFHYNVSVAGIFAIPEPVAVVPGAYKSHVLRAVAAVVRQHPNLSLQIRRSSSSPDLFVRLPVVDVEKLVEWRDFTCPPSSGERDTGRYLEKFLSEQNSVGFKDQQAPLWRIVCLDLENTRPGNTSGSHECAVCVVYHHAIADGKSGNAILATLRDALLEGQEVGETEGNFCVWASSSEIPPSMDELVPYSTTWRSWLGATLRRYWQYLASFVITPPKVWTGEVFQQGIKDGRARTLIRVVQLPGDSTRRLREKCRAHGTSVTAMLQILVGDTLFRQYRDAKVVRCATALSLRPFFDPSLGIDDTKVGVWIDAFSWAYKRKDIPDASSAPENAIWKVAARSKRLIDSEVKKGLNDLSFASLKGKTDFKPQLMGLLGKARQNTYSITNLGVVPERPYRDTITGPDSWSLESVVFSQSAHVNGSAVQFCFISCEKGGLSVSMNWQEGVLQESDMDDVKFRLESELYHWSS